MLHQTVEKSLKALILKEKRKLMKIHDLLLLWRKAGLHKDLLKKAVLLNPYYTSSRYPMSITKKISLSESKTAVNYAEEILKWCKEIIKM
jgi:HEPN domain-containing protein